MGTVRHLAEHLKLSLYSMSWRRSRNLNDREKSFITLIPGDHHQRQGGHGHQVVQLRGQQVQVQGPTS
jgi:hypothetical protein